MPKNIDSTYYWQETSAGVFKYFCKDSKRLTVLGSVVEQADEYWTACGTENQVFLGERSAKRFVEGIIKKQRAASLDPAVILPTKNPRKELDAQPMLCDRPDLRMVREPRR